MVIVPHTVWGWGVCQRFEGGNEVVKMEACKHKRLGSSVICLCPLFILSSCTDVGGGWGEKHIKAGGSKSPECVHHIASLFTCCVCSARIHHSTTYSLKKELNQPLLCV